MPRLAVLVAVDITQRATGWKPLCPGLDQLRLHACVGAGRPQRRSRTKSTSCYCGRRQRSGAGAMAAGAPAGGGGSAECRRAHRAGCPAQSSDASVPCCGKRLDNASQSICSTRRQCLIGGRQQRAHRVDLIWRGAIRHQSRRRSRVQIEQLSESAGQRASRRCRLRQIGRVHRCLGATASKRWQWRWPYGTPEWVSRPSVGRIASNRFHSTKAQGMDRVGPVPLDRRKPRRSTVGRSQPIGWRNVLVHTAGCERIADKARRR